MQNQYLEVLELAPGASKAQIKSAYRRLSKVYHPDVSKDENAKEKFIEINEAYKFLTDVGPRPTTIESNAPAYDYDVQDHAYDDWRRKARAYAKKKAEDEARRQVELTKVFLNVFEISSLVFGLINLAIVLDLVLPYQITETKRWDASVFHPEDYSYYETLWVDDYEIKVKKKQLNFLLVEQQVDEVILYTTQLLKQPVRAVVNTNWKTYSVNQFAGLFGFFKFVPFLIIGIWLCYKYVADSLDAQLSLSVLFIFFVFFETIIYLLALR